MLVANCMDCVRYAEENAKIAKARITSSSDMPARSGWAGGNGKS